MLVSNFKRNFRHIHKIIGNLYPNIWGIIGLFVLYISIFSYEAFSAETKIKTTGSEYELLGHGLQAFQNGNFEEAIKFWKQPLPRLTAYKDKSVLIETYISLASAYEMIGLYRNGLNTLMSSKPYLKDIDSAQLHSKWQNQRANLYLALGRKQPAIFHFKKALDGIDTNEVPMLAANILNNFGNALWLAKYQGDAIDAYQRSLQIALDHHAYALSAQILLNIIRVKIALKQYEEVGALFEQTSKILDETPEDHSQLVGWITLSRLAMEIINKEKFNVTFADIHKWLEKSISQAKAIDDKRSLSYALGYLGQLYEVQVLHKQAIQKTRQALFIAQEINAPDILYMWYWQLGRIWQLRGDIKASLKFSRRAVDTLAPVKKEVSYGYRNTAVFFQKNIKPVYTGLVDLLLIEAKQNKNAREALLVEAQNIIELMKTAELEDYFQDECVLEAKNDWVSLNKIDSNTAVLYPIILPDRLELLLTISGEIIHKTVPVNAAVLNDTANQLRIQLQNRHSRRFFPYARRLYNWLVLPFEKILSDQKIDTLVYIPEGELRTIPLSAVHDGEQFLIEKYAVALSPGLSLTSLAPLQTDGINSLLTGISEPVRGFSALPNVVEELNGVHNTIGGTVLQNRDNTLKNLARELKTQEYSIVHMATHGVFADSAEESFLLTYDDKLTMDDLDNLLRVGQFRERGVELLTLSACETAVGDDRAALGLAGVAIKARARSALASLWLVNDRSTPLIMQEFYRHIMGTKLISKAKALQNAQKMMIDDSEYSHPADWSSFLLIGNWL